MDVLERRQTDRQMIKRGRETLVVVSATLQAKKKNQIGSQTGTRTDV